MLRSIGKQSGNPWWEGFAEKEIFKPGVKSEGVMDDESGESMEEVPLKELGEAELDIQEKR